MHMKKIIPFLLVSILALSGCQDSPKSQDIVGIWEVYDCENKEYIGTKFYFYEDGTGLVRDPYGWVAVPNVYRIKEGKLYIFDEKDKEFVRPHDVSELSIIDNSLTFKSILDHGDFSECGVMKLKRLSGS